MGILDDIAPANTGEEERQMRGDKAAKPGKPAAAQEEQPAEEAEQEESKPDSGEPGEESDSEPAEEPQAGRMVDLRALHEERGRRRDAEREREELRGQMRRQEQRLGEIMARLESTAPAPAAQELPPPDPTVDPQGFIIHKLTALEKQFGDLQKGNRERQTADQYAARQTEAVQRYVALAAEFSRKQPDFQEAYDWLARQRDEELREMGLYDPAQRMAEIRREEMWLAEQAMGAGANPAERIYAVAKLRGYQAKKGTPNGADRLTAIERGQAAAKSLGGTAGGEAPAKGTPQWLLTASEDEFDKYFERVMRKAYGA